MMQILTLVYHDFRQVFRDKTLFTFLFIPVILIVFIRLFVPYLTNQFSVVADYHHVIMMFGGIQTAIMFGFITSFLILDEKDENVLQVIRVAPISSFYFIVYRILFATFFSALGAFAMISLAGFAYPGFGNSILLSLQYGLAAPFVTLIIATFANNKVEGMAFFKAVDFILLLPMMAFFFAPWVKYIFYLFPTFWTYELYFTCLQQGNVILVFLIGILVYGLVILGLYRQFKTRVFDR